MRRPVRYLVEVFEGRVYVKLIDIVLQREQLLKIVEIEHFDHIADNECELDVISNFFNDLPDQDQYDGSDVVLVIPGCFLTQFELKGLLMLSVGGKDLQLAFKSLRAALIDTIENIDWAEFTIRRRTVFLVSDNPGEDERYIIGAVDLREDDPLGRTIEQLMADCVDIKSRLLEKAEGNSYEDQEILESLEAMGYKLTEAPTELVIR